MVEVAVGEVGEGDSSGPGRGARGAKPGGGGTQPEPRPSTRLVERPGRRGVTPEEPESGKFRLQIPEDSVPPCSGDKSGLSDKRLCGKGFGKDTRNARPSCGALQELASPVCGLQT